jgi:hypothetical protein
VAGGREMDVPVLRIGSIAVGGAQIDTPQVAIYDVSRSISTHGAVITIDGFLGFDFLGRFTMKLNPHEKTLTLQLEEPAVR